MKRTEDSVSLAIGSKGSDRNLLIAEMSTSVQNSSVRACVPSAPCGEKRIIQEEGDKLAGAKAIPSPILEIRSKV